VCWDLNPENIQFHVYMFTHEIQLPEIFTEYFVARHGMQLDSKLFTIACNKIYCFLLPNGYEPPRSIPHGPSAYPNLNYPVKESIPVCDRTRPSDPRSLFNGNLTIARYLSLPGSQPFHRPTRISVSETLDLHKKHKNNFDGGTKSNQGVKPY
jgi:hypothetical protein